MEGSWLVKVIFPSLVAANPYAGFYCPCGENRAVNKPLTKLLIANRGEIALRIIRACRELGIRTVAVYSEADQNAPYVSHADEAWLLGPGPASESYLRSDKIVELAQQTG